MNQDFSNSNNNNRLNFLKKKKIQKQSIEKKDKQIKAIKKIEAFIYYIKQKNNVFLPLLKDSAQKLLIILGKKQQLEFQKFSKMMSNAVYKMPYFFKVIIFLNQYNFRTYKQYILNLVEAITDKQLKGNIIKKIINQKGFQFYELIKLVRFGLQIIDQNQVYVNLIMIYIKQNVNLGMYQNLQKLLKQDIVKLQIIKILKGQDYKSLKILLFDQVFIRYRSQFNLKNQKQILLILIQNLSFNLEILEINSQFINSLFIPQNLLYFQQQRLQSSQSRYIFTRKWLQFLISNSKFNLKFIALGLKIHGEFLRIFYRKSLLEIKNLLFSKKMIQEDSDYEEYVDYKIKTSTKYGQFNQKIDLNFYFGVLSDLLIFSLKQQNRFQNQYIIIPIIKILLQLYNIFQNIYISKFSSLASNKLIIYALFKMLMIQQKKTLNNLDYYNKIILQFFIRCISLKFQQLDDLQFKNFEFGLTKQQTFQLIVFTNKFIFTEVNKIQNRNHRLFNDCIKLSNNLYNKCFRTKIWNLNIFQLSEGDQQLEKNKSGQWKQKIKQLLVKVPYFFSFQLRIKHLRQMIKQDKKNYDRRLYLDEEYDNDHTITIRRGNQFNDAFHQCKNKQMRQKYKIVFINQKGHEQPGIDGGGIIKQFLNRVIKLAFDPNYGLFNQTSEKQMIPNPHANPLMFQKEYQFIGLLVGKAIYENILIQPKFAGPFLNRMIGRKNCFQDLKFIDYELYKNLSLLKHNTQDISQYQFTFSFTQNLLNKQIRIIELKQNGKNIFVTNENKLQFIMAYADYKVNKEIQKQIKMFRKGFTKIIKQDWLKMFNYEQLNLMISGKDTNFDIKDLILNTNYNGYLPQDLTVRHFWQILQTMNSQQKSLVLLFVTSCSRPPTLGFKQLKPKFCIAKSNDLNHLPTAHTCMNILKLPNYMNKTKLRQKLLYAIYSKTGFELQ